MTKYRGLSLCSQLSLWWCFGFLYQCLCQLVWLCSSRSDTPDFIEFTTSTILYADVMITDQAHANWLHSWRDDSSISNVNRRHASVCQYDFNRSPNQTCGHRQHYSIAPTTAHLHLMEIVFEFRFRHGAAAQHLYIGQSTIYCM